MHLVVILIFIVIAFFILFLKKKSPSNHLSAKRKAELEKSIAERRRLVESDPDRITTEEIRSLLVSLNLSPFVLNVFDEKESLETYGFFNYFTPPYTIIGCTKEEQNAFEIDRYVPLFETMDDFLEVLAYDKVLKGFIRYSPEDGEPLNTYEVLTWDAIFVSQILTWYEDEKSDDQILKIAGLLGLKHTEIILSSIHSDLGTKYTSNEISIWEEKIIDKIDGRIN